MSETEQPIYANHAAIKASVQDDASDIFKPELSISENVKNLLAESVRFTNRRLFEPIVLAYVLLPSALCKTLPYLFFNGEAGSGKSSVGTIGSGLNNNETQQGNTTFASLRNWVNRYSFHDSQHTSPKNCCLVWDDITSAFLRDPKMYSFLKSGYSEKSSICAIALPEGEILQFHTFCPKIMSSIDPFYYRSEFVEITRRLIIIPCQCIEKMNDLSLSQYTTEELNTDILDLKTVSLKDYANQFFYFWQDNDNSVKFVETAQSLRNRKKPIKTSKSFPATDYELVPDLIACGYVHGLWSLQEGYDLFLEYFTFKKDVILKQKSALTEMLKTFIFKMTSVQGDSKIVPVQLKDALMLAQKQGELDRYPSIETINTEMAMLGYRLEQIGMVTYWVPFQ
jgi:hypothetical protein